jgi:glycine betaine catabolism B
MKWLKWLDAWLDRITMYRLLLYYLIGLLAVAAGLSLAGVLRYSALDIVLCSLFLVAVCLASNKVFAWAFEAPTNVESVYITALILALIIRPTHEPGGMVFLAAAGGLAVASKYMLAINRRHVFNPAAIAVVLTAAGAGNSASWWVGTAAMLPAVLVGGVLLVRRIRRTAMVTVFVAAAVTTTAGLAAVGGGDVLGTLQREVLSSAVFFAGFVMLTEPLTSPTTGGKRMVYAGLVGALFAPQVHVAGLYSTPELALVVGNIFSYVVGPRVKVLLRLRERVQLSRDTYDFVFTPERPFTYRPGQYMEFTFQHPRTDSRGARRYFTLASSPTESEVRLGVKFYEPGSSYKRALMGVNAQVPIVAAQLGGDFVLPKDPGRKLVFIGGGIGVTPFRSMLRYLLDTGQSRSVTLLYAAKTPDDLVYREVFEAARQRLGAQVCYLVGDGPAVRPPLYQSQLSAETIARLVPDYRERLFYVSGPHGMVVAAEEALRSLGVPRRNIKKDFFSGYA